MGRGEGRGEERREGWGGGGMGGMGMGRGGWRGWEQGKRVAKGWGVCMRYKRVHGSVNDVKIQFYSYITLHPT